MNVKNFFCAILVLAMPALLLAQGAPIGGTARVGLTPVPASSLAVGSSVSVVVHVNLSGVTGQGASGSVPAVLGGYQVSVAFDKTRLQLASVAGGSSSGFTSTPTYTNTTTANANGAVTIVASQTSASSPTGDVAIASLAFTTTAVGTAQISASAGSLSSALQLPNFGPTAIPSNGSSINVDIVSLPGTPSTPSPSNGAQGVARPVTLSWTATGATSYNASFGTTVPPPWFSTTTSTSISVQTQPGTTYYWSVTAVNGGGSTPGPIWSFKTSGTAPCATLSAPAVHGPATVASGSPIQLTWSPVTGAASYRVEESTDSAFSNITSATTSAAAFQVTKTVSADTTFYYRVVAINAVEGCPPESAPSAVVAVVVTAPPPPVVATRVLIVAGSTAGALGSRWRTAVQLQNPFASLIHGTIVFHAAGTLGSSLDPSKAYDIGAQQVLTIPDLIAWAGQSGMGSVDFVSSDPFPIAFVRLFNDGADKGTTGVSVDLLSPGDALMPGDTAVLVGPADPIRMRFNIGVRTLSDGAAFDVTIRNAQGAVVTTTSRSFPATYSVQMADSQFLGTESLPANYTVTVTVKSGSAFLYGSLTDDTTQDPTLQMAHRVPH